MVVIARGKAGCPSFGGWDGAPKWGFRRI